MKILIILLAMLAAGAGALHARHSKDLYIRASLLAEAFVLSASPKLRVADHYLREGRMPHDNASAGLALPKVFYGTSVTRISVNPGGVLVVEFADGIGRESMTFTPTASPVSGLLDWQCTSDSIDPAVLERMKPGCSYLPATPGGLLMDAIANGDAALVRRMLADGVAPDHVVDGNTPLMLAVKGARLEIVRDLLDAGAHVDNGAIDDGRRTPLMIAMAGDRATIASELLARGASVARRDFRGMDVLDHAGTADARHGGSRYTLLASARLNPRFAGRGVASGNVARSADERRAGDRTSRAARFADAMGRCDLEAGEALSRDGPAIDPLGAFEGVSPLARAVLGGCSRVVAWLLRERDLDGRIPPELLTSAIREAPQGERVALVGVLINAGADVRRTDAGGEAALALAIALEQPVVAKYLIDAGADVDAATVDGSTPLIEATKKGYLHLAGRLIDAGADVDRRDASGRTALLAAVARDRRRLVERLLRGGADARIRDANGVDAWLLADSRDLGRVRTLLATASVDR